MLGINKMSEYSGSQVSGGACAYASLGRYNNQGAAGLMGTPPIPSSTTTGMYVVPAYGMPGYDALTHGSAQPSCSGFFNITNAYGANAGNCNQQYVRSMCN
jgi:hypothetical protein